MTKYYLSRCFINTSRILIRFVNLHLCTLIQCRWNTIEHFLITMSNVFIMDDQPTNVENLSPSFYIAICVLCSVTFDWLWLPRTFILLAVTFQLTRQESPWATKASQAGSTKMSLEVLGWQNVLKCLRGFYWMHLKPSARKSENKF